jgi:signal transduction histidine kinase
MSDREGTATQYPDSAARDVDGHVGSRIRQSREDRGRSLQSLAAQLNIAPEQLESYESGRERMSASKLKELADALDVPLSHFFSGLAEHLDTSSAAGKGWRHFATLLRGPLLLSIAYYLGAEAAFYVGTLSDRIFAPFWPPNVILFCVLLFVPYRDWWIYVIAAIPAHVLAEQQVGMYVPQMATAFATNCMVALLNAFLMRRLLGGPPWFDNFQRAIAYVLITAVVGPGIVALAGAFVRISGGGALESYGLFWAQWYLANALASLTLGPAILSWVGWTTDLSDLRSRWRQGEAILVATLLALAGLVVGRTTPVGAGGGMLPALLYLPLPAIIWASVRFGAMGGSWAVLIVTVLAIWPALNGSGMFVGADPERNVLDLQLFLAALSVPVLLLGACVDGARSTEQMIRRLARCLIAARDDERRRIGNDLHVSISQSLVSAARMAEDARRAAPEMSGKLRRLEELLQQSVRDVRGVSRLLHPPLLDAAGLESALSQYVEDYSERNRTRVGLEVSPDLGRLPPNVELALFRLAEQALETVRRKAPSAASRIKIARVATSGEPEVLLTVEGVAQATALGGRAPSFIGRVLPLAGLQGLDIASMRERVGRFGGRLRVDASPGKAVVLASVPMGRGL